MRKILFPHHRAGLSLIEILASVFILLIGILGVLSAVTLGGFQIRRVKIADQSAACGRAALAQIRMSDWQKEENIVDSTLADIVNYTNPYIVDPLGYFNLGTGSFDGSRSTLGTLDRFTLKTIKNTILYYRSQDSNLTFDQCYRSIAFRDFYWSDEIRFNVLDQQRTEIQMRDAEVSEQGGKVPAADENFSWMFMVTPQNDNNLCEVSAIVFYLRGNPADGERTCNDANFNGLTPDNNSPNGELTITGGSEEAIDVSTIRYILLVDNGTPKVAKWYRIISDGKAVKIDDGGGKFHYERTLFITGSPWTSNQTAGLSAVLCDGVTGVYTAVMPRE